MIPPGGNLTVAAGSGRAVNSTHAPSQSALERIRSALHSNTCGQADCGPEWVHEVRADRGAM
jgi:hypothetical protein